MFTPSIRERIITLFKMENMKKISLLFVLIIAIASSTFCQEKKKKKFKLKMPEVRIREKLGGLAGSLMTGKTDILTF